MSPMERLGLAFCRLENLCWDVAAGEKPNRFDEADDRGKRKLADEPMRKIKAILGTQYINHYRGIRPAQERRKLAGNPKSFIRQGFTSTRLWWRRFQKLHQGILSSSFRGILREGAAFPAVRKNWKDRRGNPILCLEEQAFRVQGISKQAVVRCLELKHPPANRFHGGIFRELLDFGKYLISDLVSKMILLSLHGCFYVYNEGI